MRVAMKRMVYLPGLVGLLVLFLGIGGLSPMMAQAEAEFHLKLMGINRSVFQYKLWQDWAKAVEERTNGRVAFEFTSLPELGFGGAETVRLVKTGIVDIAEMYLGYVAGELPIAEMLEIPGILPDDEAMVKAYEAWKPHLAEIIDKQAGGILLGTAFATDQFLFSRKPIEKLEDFRGYKARVHSVSLAQLVGGLGGEPLTIAFAEVYTAMERGTVDGGFTASFAGDAQKWYEVTQYLVGPITQLAELPLVISKKTWKRLPADIQKVLHEEAERIIDAQALKLRQYWHQNGIDGCVARGMKVMALSPELQAEVKKVLQNEVVPAWVKRSGGKRAADFFNKIVAPHAGFTVTP
jgi:TRAP-type C4-dicarboxylate transport system substrate-binding protein